MACADVERKRSDYRRAVEAERDAVAHGDRNFKGIGLEGGNGDGRQAGN